MKKLMVTLALVVMTSPNFFGHSSMNATAEKPAGPAMSHCYKSITIRKGDSSWAIAKEHSQDTELSVKEYVDELKRMNGSKEDIIHAGDHLTIMYLAAAEQMKQRIQRILAGSWLEMPVKQSDNMAID